MFSKKIFAILLLAILHLVNGTSMPYKATLNCYNLDAENCKTKFIESFDHEFKTMHLNVVKKLFPVYMKASMEIANQLPKDDKYADAIKEVVQQYETDLKRIDENINNDIELGKILRHSFGDLEMDILDPKQMPKHADIVQKVSDKYQMHEMVFETLTEMMNDSVDKWNELFVGLRSTDLEKYPLLNELNDVIKNIKNEEDIKIKGNTFFDGFIKKLRETLKPSYIVAIKSIFN